jgi:hypothetical protein
MNAKRTWPLVLAGLSLTVAMVGCGDHEATTAAGTRTTNATSAAPASPAATPSAAPDATAVLKALGIEKVRTTTEDNDPNNLIGRPNGYVSRATGYVAGGDISDPNAMEYGIAAETYATAEGAAKRVAYLKAIRDSTTVLGTEWTVTTPDQMTVVRVAGTVKPSIANQILNKVGKL